jgi:adenine-specific DNA-methyltransferase
MIKADMQKLKLHSPDLTQANIDKLAAISELFPNCVTEALDAKGVLSKSVDFDQLRQELSATLVEGPQERYQLNWPGKREALLTANAPIAKTLRPCRDESVDFDTTQNLFIEGDNLDALKLLQETYLNKVKMIYIDPPYNTGKDFIYEDDFAEDIESYLERSNQKDLVGNRMVANFEANGRFHSDWLTMIYSRLRLARSLLSDEGVIFISIDDGEVGNLRKICDEIFGEEMFAAQIIWKKRSTPPNDRVIGAQHDYILVYVKKSLLAFNLRKRTNEQVARYKNPDNHPKGPWTAGDLMGNVKGGRYVASLHFPITNPRTGQQHVPSSNGNWRFNAARINELIENDEIYFGEDDQGRPKLKRFLSQVKDGITWTTLWDFAPLNTVASNEMTEIFGNLATFENPKPVDLIRLVLEAGSSRDGIILDFFSGSGTTAHATLAMNAYDGGNRRFIMVQLPEICRIDSEPGRAGYKTIADIGKERIRRAGKKIKQENVGKSGIDQLDIGFRVLKIDSSNMKEVFYTPDAVSQDLLSDQVNNIREDRTSEDLLFQVLLDWGVDLALPISQETIDGKPVFFVDANLNGNPALAACFETDINEDFVKLLAKRAPLRVVFRDAGFASDSVKINVEQIFKLMSPGTEVKCI